jgi:hypothetical protein
MKKRMTEEEIFKRIEMAVKKGGRLVPISDENGKLQNGLKVVRFDCGDGRIVLKIGTIDEICIALGIERPISDEAIPHLIKVKFGAGVTISDRITDSLTDENVQLMGCRPQYNIMDL